MNDDELLELLRRTLARPTPFPPSDGFVALHRALSEQSLASRPSRKLHRRWAIPAVTATIVVGSAAGALAATGLPEPLRDAAQLVRLPVSDPRRPTISELVSRLRADRARGDSRAARQDARQLQTLLNQGTGNATDRAEANKTLDEPEGPQSPSLPGPTTTSPAESQPSETEPPAESTTTHPNSPTPTTEVTEPDSTPTQPSPPTPATDAAQPTPTTSQPSSGPSTEPSGGDPITPSAVEL